MFPFAPRMSFMGAAPDTRVNDTFKNVYFPDSSENANPYAGLSSAAPAPEQSPTSLVDVFREVMQHQDGPAMSEYKKYLEKGYPNPQDFKPGKLTRLGAILSGMATGFSNPAEGPQVTQSLIRAPYQQALQRYDLEGQRLEKGAALEESGSSKRLGLAKDISDAMYKNSELLRQNRLADADIAEKASTAAKNGQIVVQDKTTGHTFIKDRTGNTVADLGKLSETADEASKRQVQEAIDKARGESPIIENREKNLENQRTKDTASREKDVAQFNYDLWNKKENTRQSHRLDLQNVRDKAQLDRDAAKAKLSLNNVTTSKLIANRQKVESLVDADTAKYGKFWQTGPTGNKELGPAPSTNDPTYNDYVTLYNELYKGLNQLSPAGGSRFKITR